jgi:predicted TIM-barrel fold metal-dependent hydrolase
MLEAAVAERPKSGTNLSFRLVDADAHIDPPYEMWREYLPANLRELAPYKMVGRNIMWSSDYPHSETTFPRSHEIIIRDFEGIPEKDIRDICCNRAKKLYGVQ